MDCLELCVSNRRLSDRRQVVAVAEIAQIVQKALHLLWRRRYKLRFARAVVAASDPILSIPDDSSVGLQPRAKYQAPVDFADVIEIDFLCGANVVDSPRHGVDIAQDFFGGEIARLFAKLTRDFRM